MRTMDRQMANKIARRAKEYSPNLTVRKHQVFARDEWRVSVFDNYSGFSFSIEKPEDWTEWVNRKTQDAS